MDAKIPDGATKVTFTMWTTGAYNDAEKKELLGSLADSLTEYDDDVVRSSSEIAFQTAGEIVDAANKAIVDALNTATPKVTIEFPQEARFVDGAPVVGFSYEFGLENGE